MTTSFGGSGIFDVWFLFTGANWLDAKPLENYKVNEFDSFTLDDLMERVQASELMSAGGVRGINTIRKWIDAELIPEPEIVKNPGGSGTVRLWEPWVVNRCRKIKELRADGKKPAEIKNLLGTNWADERLAFASASPRHLAFREVCERADRSQALLALRER